MYKLLLTSLTVLMVFGTVSSVNAKNNAPSEALQRIKFDESTKQKLEELKLEREKNREEVQTKLQNVKDERKKQIAENLGTRLCDARVSRIEKLKYHLGTMNDVLDKVELKANNLETAGKDVTSARKEITEARAAISSARTAVEAFAGVDCGLKLSGTETQLHSELSTAVKNLEKEFKTLQVKLTEARKATAEAIRAVAVINNEVAN